MPDRYGSHAHSPTYTKLADGTVSERPDGALDYATYHIRKFYPEYLKERANASV
jgi:hypothetical protein